MNKVEAAMNFFGSYNCAQTVLVTYAEDYGLDKNKALQAALGFGGGIGRLQDICGAVSGAVITLGLSSGFKEGDGRDKIDAVYTKVRSFIDDFTSQKGTIKCRDLLGCDLSSEEGNKFFRDNNLRDKNCREYIRLCCELLDKHLGVCRA